VEVKYLKIGDKKFKKIKSRWWKNLWHRPMSGKDKEIKEQQNLLRNERYKRRAEQKDKQVVSAVLVTANPVYNTTPSPVVKDVRLSIEALGIPNSPETIEERDKLPNSPSTHL
jgi:hypothetical protein